MRRGRRAFVSSTNEGVRLRESPPLFIVERARIWEGSATEGFGAGGGA